MLSCVLLVELAPREARIDFSAQLGLGGGVVLPLPRHSLDIWIIYGGRSHGQDMAPLYMNRQGAVRTCYQVLRGICFGMLDKKKSRWPSTIFVLGLNALFGPILRDFVGSEY